METKSYGGSYSEVRVNKEVNRIVLETIQELRTLSTCSNYSMTDLAELFVRKLLKRLGVPIDDESTGYSPWQRS